MRPPGGPDKHVQCFLHVFCLPCFCIFNFTTSSHRDSCVYTLTNDVWWSSSELFLSPSSPLHSPTHFDTCWPLTLLFVSVLGHCCCTLRFWNDNFLFVLRPFAYHLLCSQLCPCTHICCRSIFRTRISVYTNCFQLWCFLRWVARSLSYCLLLSYTFAFFSRQSNTHSKYTSFTSKAYSSYSASPGVSSAVPAVLVYRQTDKVQSEYLSAHICVCDYLLSLYTHAHIYTHMHKQDHHLNERHTCFRPARYKEKNETSFRILFQVFPSFFDFSFQLNHLISSDFFPFPNLGCECLILRRLMLFFTTATAAILANYFFNPICLQNYSNSR